MDVYLKISGALFNFILIIYLINIFIKKRYATYVIRTRYSEDGVKEEDLLHLSMYELFVFGVEIITTSGKVNAKDQVNNRAFVNGNKHIALKIINANWAVVYVKMRKFWKGSK